MPKATHRKVVKGENPWECPKCKHDKTDLIKIPVDDQVKKEVLALLFCLLGCEITDSGNLVSYDVGLSDEVLFPFRF